MIELWFFVIIFSFDLSVHDSGVWKPIIYYCVELHLCNSIQSVYFYKIILMFNTRKVRMRILSWMIYLINMKWCYFFPWINLVWSLFCLILAWPPLPPFKFVYLEFIFAYLTLRFYLSLPTRSIPYREQIGGFCFQCASLCLLIGELRPVTKI